MRCRHCKKVLIHTFLDLGFAPPSNAYLSEAELSSPETYYPLRIKVCEECWLVQTEDYPQADQLFQSDYTYFSSTSITWLRHAEQYTTTMASAFSLNGDSLVIEVASNDGYLLKNFLAKGIPCLGIEPTDSTAAAAERLGIPVIREFFGEELGKRLASEGKQADLIVGNNVYAHVPDINDFTRGLKVILKSNGTITLEFPHLMSLLTHAQFDTVYHEHFSYLSLQIVSRIFASAGLRVWNVEELPTHGGSLRIFGCHDEDKRKTSETVTRLLLTEKLSGMQSLAPYLSFQGRADKIKDDLLSFLIEKKREGFLVAAYGAAAKGNTLLNYAGIKPDLLPYVCDAADAKQGRYLPGSHIPIYSPNALRERVPNFILILPWNIAEEVRAELMDLEALGVKLITAIPELRQL